MLYYSRTIKNANEEVEYGIVDTDDDVETLIGWGELKDVILSHKLPVEGIIVKQGITGPYIADFLPYQDKRYVSPKQVRAKTLLGVDIRVYKGIITYIEAIAGAAKDGVTIRLSDYGTKLANNAFIGWRNNKDYMINVILDDKLVDFDFSQYYASHVCWHISEVTNDKILNVIRFRLRDTCRSGYDWNKHVKDDKWRIGWRNL